MLITCKIHGDFEIVPSKHLSRGDGCKNCGIEQRANKQRSTSEEFIERAKMKHKDENGNPIYTYEKVNYINAHTSVCITCKIHDAFYQKPHNHLNGATCLNCSNEKSSEIQRMSIEEFIEKAKEIHGDTYDYSQTIYGKNNAEHVNIMCKNHGLFYQSPSGHLAGRGCYNCRNDKLSMIKRVSLDECINRFRQIHGDKYDYTMVEYRHNHINVKIRCIKHDILFYQTPSNHYRSTGCMKCHKKGYSKKAILWLELISKMYNINIQHAENGNEYTIPNNKKRVDGYCKETNTIYEFHGDYWHGNPKIYNFDNINYVINKSFGKLYQNTIKRENIIRQLGYNLVVMWENDWDNLNKNIKKLQQNYRCIKI